MKVDAHYIGVCHDDPRHWPREKNRRAFDQCADSDRNQRNSEYARFSRLIVA
jgi:hypothetical protein